MKNILLLLSIILIATNSIGQQNKPDTIHSSSTVSIPTKLSIDTLKIQNVDTKESSKIWYKDENMPWIIVLIFTILGHVISFYQITQNKKITLKQIKATLSTSNRQDWVTETRNVITEFITQARLLNIEFQEKNQNNERNKMLDEKVSFNRTKLRLLLNPKKEMHKKLLDSLSELVNTFDEHSSNRRLKESHNINIPYDNVKFLAQMDQVAENGRNLLYDEWGKIQSVADKIQ